MADNSCVKLMSAQTFTFPLFYTNLIINLQLEQLTSTTQLYVCMYT